MSRWTSLSGHVGRDGSRNVWPAGRPPVVIVCRDDAATKGQRSPRTGTLAGTPGQRGAVRHWLVGRCPIHAPRETSQGGRQMTSTSDAGAGTRSRRSSSTTTRSRWPRWIASTGWPRSWLVFQPIGGRTTSPRCSTGSTKPSSLIWRGKSHGSVRRSIRGPRRHGSLGWFEFDHRQIADQANRVKAHQSQLDRGPSREAEAELFGDLLGLETLLRADLEREEHFLIPLLANEADRWTPEWRD